ncbi:dimethylallyltranstransferase [Actinophytocola xinjiangensis]|uniref:Dimethylallyltranstransferase n=1 Tax=Actinophytocola xinjiangensis TaxID=485602 RepID=A0A7Z0WPQ2_9PSEU|nr:family 2 encapsulin nanocompartment cargo protein polyprenyl transferase [Actinophytocola xinjiangensis]OLF12102.1 dimethylallyltranstransferase [Actinophytocola xinjiangensis]
MAPLEIVEDRSGTDVLEWSRGLVRPALRAALDRLPVSMRRVAEYHFGWSDEHGRTAETVDTGGKSVRPALVLLAARAVGGSERAAVPAACAAELVHNFTLLHDDVMDRDPTRRHRAASWSVFGASTAILAGDALLTLAFDVLADTGREDLAAELRLLTSVLYELVDGQSADLAFERRSDVALLECVHMAAGKTGSLLGGACGLGAISGGGDSDQVEALRGFGRHLGLAFQYVDDLLGIWGDPATTGKPVHSDLVNRKKSLPVVATLTAGTPAGAELAELYRRDAHLSPGELARAADLIEAAGARAWAQDQAREHHAQALACLRDTGLDPGATADLGVLAALVVNRDH